MIKGITYYKLVSDYEGAIPPKDCGLKGEEIDNNFYVLEGRDIKSVTVEDNRIVITLVNGETISSDEVFNDFVKDLSFDFDAETGTLYITQNGQTTEITGFGIDDECCFKGVYTDESLTGKGTIDDPLSISPAFRPGSFAPVHGLIDKTQGETLPDTTGLAIGTRYLVKDYMNEFGMLYCYKGVQQICCELDLINSEWRIPRKEDWDDMLNAVEPFEEDRNHSDKRGNQWLGKYAGKLLKSLHTADFDYWTYEEPEEEEPEDDPCSHCCDEDDPCRPCHCGEHSGCHDKPTVITPEGTDQYGFDIVPTGYGVDVAGRINCAGFGDIATFWTSEVTRDKAVAYIKGFQWNETRVQQDIVPTNQYHALRLVKDYNGHNYYGREEILGNEYDTVLMPSLSGGSKVWTAVNFAKTGEDLCAIEPGCGNEDLPKTIVYYIVEWTGENWVSTAVKEGYTVTIIVNGTPIDYHIVINQETGDAELVPNAEGVADEVIEIIQERLDGLSDKIDAEHAKNEEQDGRLNTIEGEIDGLKAKDILLDERIDQLAEGMGDVTTLTKRLINQGEFDKDTSEVVLQHKGVNTETGEEEINEIARVKIPFDFGEV